MLGLDRTHRSLRDKTILQNCQTCPGFLHTHACSSFLWLVRIKCYLTNHAYVRQSQSDIMLFMKLDVRTFNLYLIWFTFCMLLWVQFYTRWNWKYGYYVEWVSTYFLYWKDWENLSWKYAIQQSVWGFSGGVKNKFI